MNIDRRMFTYGAALFITIILVALTIWFVFLRSEESRITQLSENRGFATGTPSFFGTIGSTGFNLGSGLEDVVTISENGTPPRLWRVTASPVAGMAFFAVGTSTKLYYADRATGHIFATDPESGEVARLSNTLIPHVAEAEFITEDRVALRYTSDDGNVETFLAELRVATSSEGTLSGSYLEKNVVTIASSPNGREIFYIAPSGNGALGILARHDGSSKKTIFSSPVSGWRAAWAGDNRITIVQRAADNVSGSAYSISRTGSRSPIAENVPGLTLSHASGTRYVYGESRGGALSLYASSEASSPIMIELTSVADKCGWIPGRESLICAAPNNLPSRTFLNNWYKGSVHPSDSLWRVNAVTGASEMVVSPETEYSVLVDVSSIKIDATGSYAAFIDNMSGALWVFRLK